MKSTINDLKGQYSEQLLESPLFERKTKARLASVGGNTDNDDNEDDLLPTSRSISPDSLMQSSGSTASTKKLLVLLTSSRDLTPLLGLAVYFSKSAGVLKKNKIPSRVPIATGFSTTIPVTGEKPKPQQEGDASLEDDVLYAIFLILHEKDAEGQGMTVKQICDVLVERHPQMAQLLSKTSNLVSAKLNAYVKRVEKGDAQLKYALSREWADASPKRMVYVYRGLLTKDFHVHVKKNNLSNINNQLFATGNLSFANGTSVPEKKLASPGSELEAAKHSALAKPRRQTMYDLGVARPAFVDSPIDKSNLFVPYSSAPVAASLTEIKEKPAEKDDETPQKEKTDFEFDDLEVFNDDDDDIEFPDFANKNGKRSKSMSYLLTNKKAKIITAAAAAPRVPKAPCSHSPTAAAAAAALHAAALKAIAAAAPSRSSSRKSSCSLLRPPADWSHMVRSGFLTEDIRAPEDISLSDLDKLFS